MAAALAVAVAIPASADSLVVNNPENRPYFGARVSIDISSSANGGRYYSSKPGFAVGAVYNIPVWKNLYFEPGLSVFYDVFGTTYFNIETIQIPDISSETGYIDKDVMYQVDGSIRNLGFRIPLNIGYHFDFAEDLRVSVFTGPQFNASVIARYHQDAYTKPSGAKEASFSKSAFGTGGFKHFDAQWNFGVGLDWENYTVALTGSVGMTRLRDAIVYAPGVVQPKTRRNLFAITLGYNF